MTPEFIIGDLVEYITYVDPTDNWQEYPVTALITGFYDYDTREDLGNNYTTHDRVIYANLLSDQGEHTALLTEIALLSSAPRC
tara:strand:+ start:287 stop:535 length:249 start_codon:yes stop_codon:yes gene_type:complete